MTINHDFSNIQTSHSHNIRQCPFDPSEYMDELSEFDMNEEEKEELLRALWQVMNTFVAIGFGQDSAQHILQELENSTSRDSKKLVKQFKANNQRDLFGVNYLGRSATIMMAG